MVTTKEKETVNISEERKKALKVAIDKIEKDFGKGSIMRLGDKPAVAVETIPTGALSLDVALGIGGVPRGRIIEVYGPEASGKTTLAQHIVAECQKKGFLRIQGLVRVLRQRMLQFHLSFGILQLYAELRLFYHLLLDHILR